MLTLKECIDYLVNNGYVTEHKGKLKFMAKYYADTQGVLQGLTPTGKVIEPALSSLGIVPKERSLIPLRDTAYTPKDWRDMYLQFIMNCQIPARLGDGRGGFYPGNKYSENGMKAFQKAIRDEGYDYKVLCAAVALYYKTSILMKKAIGTYMESGEWRTDYEELINSAQTGTVKSYVDKQRSHGSDSYDPG